MGGNQRTAESQNFRPLLHFPGFSLMKIHMRIYNYGARDLRAYKLRQRLSMYFPPSLSSSINRVDPHRKSLEDIPCRVPSFQSSVPFTRQDTLNRFSSSAGQLIGTIVNLMVIFPAYAWTTHNTRWWFMTLWNLHQGSDLIRLPWRKLIGFRFGINNPNLRHSTPN